jgi:hypothetical protein
MDRLRIATVRPRHDRVASRRVVRRAAALVAVATTAFAVGVVLTAAPVSAASGPSIAGTGAPLPANATPGSATTLASTACPAAGNCVAVGLYQASGGPAGLIETESGGTWHALAAPMPSGATTEALIDVSCSAVGSCVAAGQYEDSLGHEQGVVLTEAGGSWTVTALPTPPGAAANPDVTLVSLVCPAAGACVAVGIYMSASAAEVGLLVTESGGVWSEIPAPLPPDATLPTASLVLQVSCAAAGSCEATGAYQGPAERGLLLTLAGGSWTASPSPLPADASGSSALFGLSCPAVGVCMAIGQYSNGLNNTVPYVVSVSGASATAAAAPLPGNASAASPPTQTASLFSIDCPSTTSCVAAGGYDTAAGATISPLIDTYANGSWTAMEAPGTFSPSSRTLLVSVSCSWPGSCSVFGVSASVGPPASAGVIETLQDGTWSESSTVIPSDGSSPPHIQPGLGLMEFALGSPISCSAGYCVLAGSYQTMGGVEMGFLNWTPNLSGYQLVASDGGLFAFNAPFNGSMGGQPLNQPVVGMAGVPDSGGYYEVAADGGLFAFGAPFYGSMGGQHLNAPVVGIAFDSRTGGYYEVASDGGIFAFNAPFYGSMGGQHLNKPIVGIAFDPATGGYYEVASDGGLFAFNAPFSGSTGNLVLNKPVVGMDVDVATGGYYEVASDGGLFAFNAPFQGSMGGQHLNKPVVGMASDYVTGGYYEVASDGGIFAFNAPFQGSTGSLTLNKPVVGMGFG